MAILRSERHLYPGTASWLFNTLILPLKLFVPQPIIARIPGLTTNADLRIGMTLDTVRGKLLDIGCGPNRLVREYRAKGGEGIGVDVYPWPGVGLLVKDTADLPFDDNSFDTVTFVGCINHIPNRDLVLKEVARVVRPDGQLLVTFMLPVVSWIWHIWAFWDKDTHERGIGEGEVWGFFPHEMTTLLEGAGWRVIERGSMSWGLNNIWRCERI